MQKILALAQVLLKSRIGLFCICVAIVFLYRKKEMNLVSPVTSKGRTERGMPLVYTDEVDFRIIVITYDRAESLAKLLKTINKIELDGDNGALEIWIDQSEDGKVHWNTFTLASSFQWDRGPTTVHVQKSHAGIRGQWIDTWRPKHLLTKELVLILEDDISVSKYAYRWIKAAHKFYTSRDDFAGTSLTSDEQKTHDGSYRVLNVSANETVFMYKCIGTWGFSPKPSVWMEFQDWYHVHVTKPEFHPYVPGIAPTDWYKNLERRGNADSMWVQWFVYFAYNKKLFTLYNNLNAFNGDASSCLCINRREVGLHVRLKGREDTCKPLDRWDDRFVRFPANTTRLDWNGKAINQY